MAQDSGRRYGSAREARETVTLKIRAADAALGGQDVLSESEHERLANMHEGARPTFVTARAMLREALGSYMGLTASTVPLVQAGAGKRIYLDGFEEGDPPFYSVSHTGAAEEGIASIAVSGTSPIGIDIQQLDFEVDWRRIAVRRFPDEEAALLAAMPEEEGRMLFFMIWAIKERFVKMEDGKLMPYLRGVELTYQGSKTVLKCPTPGGTTEAMIYTHFIPEVQMVVALVSKAKVQVNLDCDIQYSSRRDDPFNNKQPDHNSQSDTDESAA